ncbi:MAG: SPOR domain-containing protein [Rectinema sp.]|jgi:cell division protein FtsN
MSDRSKKIVWIAVAVSGFALVVFLTAFILFPPNEASQSKPFDLTGRSPAKPLSPNDFSAFPSIVVQSSEENSQAPNNAQADSANTSKPTSSVVVVPAPSANQATTEKPSTPVPVPSPSSAPAKTTTTKPAGSTTTTPSSTAPKPSNPPSPPKASSSASEYWIQVGSFSEKGTADKLRNEFVSRGMTAIIAMKEIGGRNYYQVKVGPYASSDEAKKWLLTVKAVRGASQDAFVTTR